MANRVSLTVDKTGSSVLSASFLTSRSFIYRISANVLKIAPLALALYALSLIPTVGEDNTDSLRDRCSEYKQCSAMCEAVRSSQDLFSYLLSFVYSDPYSGTARFFSCWTKCLVTLRNSRPSCIY